MREKRHKVLKKQIPILDGAKCTAYFRDMAAEGKILDEVGYLFYYFRIDTPKEIRYATQVFTEYLSAEQMSAYEAKGWHLISRWEKEYVFATEDITLPDLFDYHETERLEVERKLIELEERAKISPDFFWLLPILMVFGISIYQNGFQMESLLSMAKEIWHWIAIFLFGLIFNLFYKRHLKRKKQELDEQCKQREEGRWDSRDIDWQKIRNRNIAGIGVFIVLCCVLFYYGCNINEKAFDMPKEIDDIDLPIIRVETLQEGVWKRAGEPVDLSREGFGLRNGTDFQKDRDYKEAKFWSRVQNYGIEYKNLPLTERKIYMTQYMEEQQTGELTGMQTVYWNYRLELLAENKFEKMSENVKHRGSGIYSGVELDWTDAKREILDIPKGTLDELIVCKITSEKGERLQILAKEGTQLMEIKYKGNVEIEKILLEMIRVFASQTE